MPDNNTATSVLAKRILPGQKLPPGTSTVEVVIGEDERKHVENVNILPWRAICKLNITARDDSKWIGTGWLISARTVITAGHCVYMHDMGGWPKSIEVIPGLDNASKMFGSGLATVFRSTSGWTADMNREHDYGAIILPAAYRPGDETGYFGFAAKDDDYLMQARLNISGYPADRPKSGDPGFPAFVAKQQWYMALQTSSVTPKIITYQIDTMGGQSGSPVWINQGSNYFCVGIHTNGSSNQNSATRITSKVFNNIKIWKSEGA